MSEFLRQFFEQWLCWVELGATTEHAYFSRETGLCAQLDRFCEQFEDTNVWVSTYRELCGLFDEHGLDHTYPFNPAYTVNGVLFGDRDNYFAECDVNMTHANEARIAFVRKVLEE